MDSTHGISLSFESIEKKFSNFQVLSDVTCSFHGPGIYLLIGANGSGKSTFLKIAAGLLAPDSGTVHRRPTRQRIRFYQHECGLYGELSVKENLSIFGSLQGASRSQIEEQTEIWGLSEILDKSVLVLSKGQQSRVALARMLLGDSDVYLFDEPSASIDDYSVNTLMLALREVSKRSLVFISTHDLSRMGGMFSSAWLLRLGALSYFEKLDEAISFYQKSNR